MPLTKSNAQLHTYIYTMVYNLFKFKFSFVMQKDKKLKDILRSGNCILIKFQKQQDISDQVLYFFSQVDLKLVARVLNMSNITTDHLLWCQNKLSKINFISQKIQIEHSFSPFPC